MEDLTEHVKEGFRYIFHALAELTNVFCDEHLNERYQQLVPEIQQQAHRQSVILLIPDDEQIAQPQPRQTSQILKFPAIENGQI